MSGKRGFRETYNNDGVSIPLGRLHQNVTVTVNNDGVEEDFLAPGDVLFISREGQLLHRIDQDTGEISAVRYDEAYGTESINQIFNQIPVFDFGHP